jgi:TatA/E family protein of Tat protein translocase
LPGSGGGGPHDRAGQADRGYNAQDGCDFSVSHCRASKEGPVMRIGLPEMLVILAILLLVFGANRLPGLGRSLGKAIRGFKDATKNNQ